MMQQVTANIFSFVPAQGLVPPLAKKARRKPASNEEVLPQGPSGSGPKVTVAAVAMDLLTLRERQ
jgi:hypothetical protein